jgi:hypothetical protein
MSRIDSSTARWLQSPPCQNSCRLVMIFNFGAIRNKYGTLRRDIEEQSSCKVVTA